MCSLYYHLGQQLYLAGLRQEVAERDRLDKEIEEHKQSCAVCAGLNSESLAEQLFGLPVAGKQEK